MNTKLAIAAARRGSGLVLLAFLAVVALPVSAATCNGNPKARIDPALGQTVPETTGGVSTVVQLNGSPSTPNNAGNLSFAWQYLGSTPAGLAVTINNPNAEIATFSAPAVGALGATLRFRLTVCGIASTAVTTDVNVTNVVVNNPPVAVAVSGPPNPHEGDLVTLDGTGSFDPDPGSTLSYAWTQTGGSPAVTLSNASSSIASFLAPNTPIDTGASLTFRLTVSDGTLSGSDEEIVNVVWTNDPPVASLACPADGIFIVNEGDPVTLDGSASSDSDGTIQSYAWSQDEGLPTIGIGALTSQAISFTAPQLGLQQLGGFRILLTVTDNLGAQDTTDCGVYINDITSPSIAVPADITAEATSSAGAGVTYAAFAQDAVDDELPYALACVPPSGSVFPLAPLPGNALTTQVVCNAADSAGNAAAPATFNITVHDTTAPVITAPGSYAIDATGPDGAVANYTATTLDAVDGGGDATCVPASGDTFPLGTTPVTCNASDARLNAADTVSFNLTVHDATPPEIAPHPDVIAEATDSTGASVGYDSPATTDIVDGAGYASCSPASGDVFPLGETTVSCNAADEAGNDAIQTSFKVFVVDTTPPVITPHGNVTAEAIGPGGANVSYDYPATSDIVDGAGTASCSPLSGENFPLGESTVHCNAADAAGNDAVATSFKVFVVDTTPPLIDAHPGVTAEATGSTGAIVSYTSPGTIDIVDGAGTASCSPLSGGNFPLGESTVHCNAADVAGNQAVQTSFKVFVVDTTAPVIASHLDITAEATSSAGASVGYTSPATTDIVDGDGTATCTPASASTFALGETTVHCDATDLAGNAAIQTAFKVLVVDTTAPVVAAPANVTKEATGPLTAVDFGTANATDAVGVTWLTHNAPALFPLGTTVITWTAKDAAGNTGNATSTVTIVDTTPPLLTTPGHLTREATSPAGAAVGFSTSAIDLVDGAVAVSCTPASGSTFALGSTTVACSAADAGGNTAHASFNVTVQDTTAPTIAPHADVDATASGNSSAVVNYSLPTASDLVDTTVPVSCTPASGSTFDAGATTVTCSATDAAGNTATSTFAVNVSYVWSGFFSPVDNLPVWNKANAGSAIPLKFGLGGNQGMDIFAAGFPVSGQVQCNSTAVPDLIEETVNPGASTLQYDAGTNRYHYVWKTSKAWAGTCRQLQIKLRDGSVHIANFTFPR